MNSVIKDIGQMFMAGFDGLSVEPGHPVVKAIEHDRLGGVILFDRNVDGSRQNIESPAQLRELTSSLQSYAEVPLLVAIDQEGGQVCRLKRDDGFPATFSAGYLSSRVSLADAAGPMEDMAATLADHGINLNLAPVTDLAVNPENPIISRFDRSFGREVETVVRYASQFIEKHHHKGVACCLKHFPGHGSSNHDSHLGFVDVTESWQEREIEPYSRLITAGLADAVMTAHVVHRGFDPLALPATLSAAMLDGMLRRDLEFPGVVISDDLQMKAISDRWNLEQAVQMAVAAGVDLIIIGNNLIREKDVTARGIRAIEELLTAGKVTEQRLNASLERIGILKKKITGELAWKNDRPTTC